jgi:hypothetical protein
MDLLLVGLQSMLIWLLVLLLFRIIFYLLGRIDYLQIFFLFEKGRINKIAIDITRAITPPSLLGIDRKIAYANRKYHSGWMCTGVTSGLAGVKLSGSPSI